MRSILFSLLLSLSFTNLLAQSTAVDSATVYRNYLPIRYQPTIRFDGILKTGAQLYGEAAVVFPDEYYSLNEFYRLYVAAGYEHKSTDHWYLGFSAKYNYSPTYSGLIPRVNITHRGKIGKTNFIKELNYEHLLFFSKYKREAEGRVSFMIGFSRNFVIAKKDLYVALSYRPYINFDFKNDGFSIYKNRGFDRARLRIDLLYKFTPSFYAGIYFSKDTEMYYTLGGVSGQTGPYPDYKMNRISSILGISLNFILHPERNPDFLAGLPSR
jgi:hypothetical protein